MKSILSFLVTCLIISTLSAQDFKLVDYTEGFDKVHPADKTQKINVMKGRAQLTWFDFDKNGKQDTIVYKLYTGVGGVMTASIQVFDAKEDDWVKLYKMELNGFGGEDGLWFYQLNESPTPRLLFYTARNGNKFLTIVTYDAVGKKFVSKEYKLNPKNLFPHYYVVNKKQIRNHSGANSGEMEAYEKIKVEY
jgi:hypothetical protein